MRLQNFVLEIPEGKERDGGYVELTHCQQYSILLKNNGYQPCDAEVSIDGRVVGIWRLDSQREARLERPVHDTGRFTFYIAGTGEASKAGLIHNDLLGLVSVLFKPQQEEFLPSGSLGVDISHDTFLSLGIDDVEAGGTGLSGNSSQQYRDVKPIEDYDENGFITINLRLVAVANEPRPLFPSSTPVPPVPRPRK